MRFYKRFKLVAMALSVLTTFAIPVNAAPLPIQACAIPNKAAAGNVDEAIILVYLANEDGTPNKNAEMPRQGQDPNGGVELKGSNWSFETLAVPPTYYGAGTVVRPGDFFNPAQTQQVSLQGQLRIMQVYPLFRQGVANDPRAGLYVFRILPRYGFPGHPKATLRWVSGEYQFRISYRDGSNQGTALGVLIIR
jgi:hypothetical protein